MPKFSRFLTFFPILLWLLSTSVGCGDSTPNDIRVVSLFLGDLAEGHGGCPPLEFANKDVLCYEGLYQTHTQVVLADVILVDTKTGCILSSKDAPSWSWGYHYRFERLGSNAEGVWIYEGRSNFTFVVRDRHVMRFCPGRVLPQKDMQPCTCTPIPAVRMEQIRKGAVLREKSIRHAEQHHRDALFPPPDPTPTTNPR